ncbi:MAG: P-loop NTPase, partial [Myxococcota bacterium]
MISLAIGGGKGGTGKSLVALQMGILMADQGLRVVLVDADPDGANLHTFVGLEDPQYSIVDVLLLEKHSYQVVLPSGFRFLGMIAGFSQDVRVYPTQEHVEPFWEELQQLDADLVLVDVGSGCRRWQTELFSRMDVGVLVLEPTFQCMEKEFFFLRQSCMCRLAKEHVLLQSQRNWLPVPWLASLRRKDAEKAKALRALLGRKPVLA